MEEWLRQKKLNEAYTVAQQRDTRRQQEIEEEARQELLRQAQERVSSSKGGKYKAGYKKWLE